MTEGQKADLFSARLSAELSALDWQARSELLIKIGRMELKMRADGQERPLWRGPLPIDKALGADVVVPTESGERRGRVIFFGVTRCPDSIDYEKSVIIHVAASGTHHEAPASLARLVNPDDVERMKGEMEMAKRLAEASEIVQRGPTPIPTAGKTKRRGEKDPGLIQRMLDAAKASDKVKLIEEGGANHKIVGVDASKRIYLFKTQLRVDISGVTVDHPGVRKISEDEAKSMHLGKVRGQVIFDDKAAAYDGFVAALEALG